MTPESSIWHECQFLEKVRRVDNTFKKPSRRPKSDFRYWPIAILLFSICVLCGGVIVYRCFHPAGLLVKLKGHSDWIRCLAFASDGKTLATGSKDSTVRVWDVRTGKERAVLRGHSGEIYSVVFSPNCKLVATAGRDGHVIVWDVEKASAINTFQSQEFGAAFTVAFSPDGSLLASGGEDYVIRLWDMTTRKERMTLHGHNEAVLSVAFSPDGELLASRSKDGIIKVWDIGKQREIMSLGMSVFPFSVYRVVFSPDGKSLLSNSSDRTIDLWDVNSGKKQLSFSGALKTPISSFSISPKGTIVVGVLLDGTVKCWDFKSAQLLCTWRFGFAHSIAFSPDGNTIAIGGASEITIWDLSEVLP